MSAFAAWSGGSFAISQVFIEKLSDKLAKTEIPFYILDIDYVSNEIQLELFKSVKWGYFESCWLEHGENKSQYNYKKELNPFIDYIEQRLIQIDNYFNESPIKSYVLDTNLPNFGMELIEPEDEIIISSKSKYKGKFLYNLMEYEKDGDYYKYEDDKLIVFEETTPTHYSSCFIKIKSEF